MIARVRGGDRLVDQRRVEVERVRVDVDEDRGRAASTTVLAEATKENAEVMTSSPGPIPNALRARSRASVPELTPTPWAAPPQRGQLGLEGLALRPEDEAAGVEHAGRGGEQLLAQGGVLPAEVDLRDHARAGSSRRRSCSRRSPRLRPPCIAEARPELLPVCPMPSRLTAKRTSSVVLLAVDVLDHERPALEAEVDADAALDGARRGGRPRRSTRGRRGCR